MTQSSGQVSSSLVWWADHDNQNVIFTENLGFCGTQVLKRKIHQFPLRKFFTSGIAKSASR
jgi:hypothetical protein